MATHLLCWRILLVLVLDLAVTRFPLARGLAAALAGELGVQLVVARLANGFACAGLGQTVGRRLIAGGDTGWAAAPGSSMTPVIASRLAAGALRISTPV